MPLLEVGNLSTHVRAPEGRIHAVDGVSFVLEKGQTLGIVGESGSGKSLIALSIMGLLPAPAMIVSGSIHFDDHELTGGNRLEQIRGRDLAMIFQDPATSLHPMLPIGTQIAEVLQRHLEMSKQQARKRALELLEEVEIPNARMNLDSYPHNLSGGMRQRVMIAIALSCNPKLLIADEPTTALDVTIQAGVLDLLDELRVRHEMALVLISHDMGVIAQVADEILVMYAGQVVEQAPTHPLFEQPEHPYTVALLEALPDPDDDGIRHRRLSAIPGRPPVVIDPGPGCRFAPRCPHASLTDGCAQTTPPLRAIRPGHLVRSAHPTSERAARSAAPVP